MINVAIIIPHLSGGGAERVACYLSCALSKLYCVFLFVEEYDESSYEHDGDVVLIEEAYKAGAYTSIDAIRYLKEKYRIDVAISFMERDNFLNILSKGSERVIVSERTTITSFFPRKKHVERLIKRFYKNADCIITCSYGVKQSLIDNLEIDRNKIEVIYNQIDCETIQDLSSHDISDEIIAFLGGQEYFISVGRLVKSKRHDALIRGFASFCKCYKKEYKLIIMGDGEEKTRLGELINELDMEESIRIVPFSANPFPYINNARALVLTSSREGFPNVLLEAMTLGTPIIATDCKSGPREILLGERDYDKQIIYPLLCEYGLLISPEIVANNGDATDDLIDAFKWAGSHDDILGNICNAQKTYMKGYSSEKIINQWISVIENSSRRTEGIYLDNKGLIARAKHIYIYGAGKVGKRIYDTSIGKYNVDAFIVSQEIEGEYHGTMITNYKNVDLSIEGTLVIIGVGIEYFDEVYEVLISEGVKNIIEIL